MLQRHSDSGVNAAMIKLPLKFNNLITHQWNSDMQLVVVALVERWTRDRKVAGSTPGWGAIKSTRSTQPSIPLGLVKRVPACMAGVKAGCIHLCEVAGNTVWSHMASDTP